MNAIVVPVEGAELHVEVDGPAAGASVLLFSGARCTTRSWDPVIRMLTPRLRVIRHDIRGTGRSRAAEDATYGLDQYAEDAAAILDHLDVETTIAWGLAFGARVAMAFASRYPARVRALALFDASVEAPDTEAQRRGAELARQQRAALGIPEVERDPSWFEHENPETLRKALAAAYRDPDHRRYADGLRVPVLIATGDHDPNLPASERLQRMIPGAELVVLEAVGHGSALARPQLCVEVFLDFLLRQGTV